MASIRPLFTITVLVVVGGSLYWKINEAPEHRAGVHRELDQRQDGVPPLAAAGGGATLAQDTAAPAWPPASAPPTVPALAPAATASTDSLPKLPAATDAKTNAPEVPAIPELPELPAAVSATPPVVPPVSSNQASDDAGPKLGGLPPLPPVSADPSNSTPQVTPPANAAAATSASSSTPPSTQPVLSTFPEGNLPPATASPNASNTSASAAHPSTSTVGSQNPSANSALDDRYGSTPASPPQISPIATTPPTAGNAAGATFAASWPAIQAALDRNDLKQAHQLLSKWHGDESLTPVESQKVESLLGQLAGTLIYSTDTQLEPARTVKQGETLDSIAKEYNVPWQLLAKINGVPAADQVRVGQQLKVVRGPFSATVDLHRKELTLEVDGKYAGAFAVTVPPGTTVGEGQWLVDQKLDGLQGSFAPSAAATNDRTIILRNAGGSTAGSGGAMLMIAGTAAVGPPGAASIRVTPQDADDLSDILSIGSRVVVRR
jgi:LysM repeat protein